MITVSAPGKLMLSGEWSVLEKGNPCIVLAVDKKVSASIKEAREIKINLKDFGIETKAELLGVKLKFEKENEKLLFTKHAIETGVNFIQGKGLRVKKFELETSGKISLVDVKGEKMKIGFGSSAAAVVAIIGAILKLHNVSIETEQAKMKLFKLAIIAHYKAQGKIGSGFDVCASVFGGASVYKRFDGVFLEKELKTKPIGEIVNADWPGLEIRKIKIPKEMEICVGFSGKSASTTELVKKVHELKERNPKKYSEIISAIAKSTEQLIWALEKNDEEKIIRDIEENRKLLRTLGEESKVELETMAHSLMAQIARSNGGAGKFSGAGGGDSSIAVCFSKESKKVIEENWKINGFYPVETKISENGVRVE